MLLFIVSSHFRVERFVFVYFFIYFIKLNCRHHSEQFSIMIEHLLYVKNKKNKYFIWQPYVSSVVLFLILRMCTILIPELTNFDRLNCVSVYRVYISCHLFLFDDKEFTSENRKQTMPIKYNFSFLFPLHLLLFGFSSFRLPLT